jgi:hypothetical protein
VNKRYVVIIRENSHYQDASENYLHGSFDHCDEAVAACRRIVDEYLADAHRPGMPVDALYELYMHFGEDPYVISDDAGCKFSAWDYAKLRCAELCGGSSQA